MQRSGKTAVLLLTVLVIVLCGCLPFLAAAVQDRMVREEAVFSQLTSVELDISGDMSLMEKLWLLSLSNYVELAETRASMQSSQVVEAARAGLEPYFNAGMIQRLTVTGSSAEPYLYYDPEDLSCNKIFWAVELRHDSAPAWSAMLMLDDETGKILQIYYYSTRSLFAGEDKQKMAQAFSKIYFHQLEVGDLVEKPELYGIEYLITDEGILNPEKDRSLNYLMLHEQYGMLQISFSVFDSVLDLHVEEA